ncbi:MAG: hypothetical protein DI630_18960 [Gordonia sp. (in: high G+C Gram-positive bacteria)]|nr:MAG: hypothetical protein DI630_18960 [Gordonia sp. (in: high G+C Gram-positive bacteria)]
MFAFTGASTDETESIQLCCLVANGRRFGCRPNARRLIDEFGIGWSVLHLDQGIVLSLVTKYVVAQ